MATIRDIERGGLAWREAGSGAPAAIFLHGLGGQPHRLGRPAADLADGAAAAPGTSPATAPRLR